jgi:hypothetical protein
MLEFMIKIKTFKEINEEHQEIETYIRIFYKKNKIVLKKKYFRIFKLLIKK